VKRLKARIVRCRTSARGRGAAALEAVDLVVIFEEDTPSI